MGRRINSSRRVIATGFTNFFRNAWLSTAATAIMFVTLTIVLSAVVINMALTDTINDIASRVTVSIYLKDGASDTEVQKFQQALKQNPIVKSVDYISKDKAVQLYKQLNANDPSLIEGLQLIGNSLPASLEVRVNNLSKVNEVVSIAGSGTYKGIVDSTSINEDRQQSIHNLVKAQDYINLGGLIAASVFAAISTLIIFNTIRMAVFARSQEIEIMKLIGAKPWYIRGPFLVESALYGVFAGIISLVVIYSALITLGPRLSSSILISPTVDYFVTHWPQISLATISLGVIIGVLSSLFAMSRYLRLKHW